MQSGKRLTLKDYFAKHTRTHKNHKNTNVELLLPFASNRKIQTFFHVCLRIKRTRWAGQTCMLTCNNQLV